MQANVYERLAAQLSLMDNIHVKFISYKLISGKLFCFFK
jgi:hypothetical protein